MAARVRHRSNSYIEAVFSERSSHGARSSELDTSADVASIAPSISMNASVENLNLSVPSSPHSMDAATFHMVSSQHIVVSKETLVNSASNSELNTETVVVEVKAEPKIFSYHPNNSAALKESGYLGNLTETQTVALEGLRQVLLSEKISVKEFLYPPAETEAHLLLRFLRARNFNVNKAWDMLKADIEWRTKTGVLELRDKTMMDIVNCDLSLVHHHLPMWQAGFDKQGRPVVYKRYVLC
jgi:hypothetical protein